MTTQTAAGKRFIANGASIQLQTLGLDERVVFIGFVELDEVTVQGLRRM
jgi:hypothetical protein